MIRARILQKTNNAIYISILAIGALFGVLFLRPDAPASLSIGDQTIPVVIADTATKRSKGLSGTEVLAPGTGMLFIFDTPGNYGFWMKDMEYPIDIVWVSSDWKVLGVSTNVAPASYPIQYYPPSDAHYVLELNTGDASRMKLDVGTHLTFHSS